VTATPQALFLQGIEHPYRPGFTILTEPGEGYVGGETFFGKTSNQHLIKYVADKEIDSLVTSKVKSASKTIPDGLKQALCTFYVAATIKELKGKGEHFSFLCHVSLKKADHDHIRELIRRFIDKVEKGLFENNDDIKKLFKKEYDELVPYVDAPPSFDEVINKMSFFITSTEIQVLNTDSKTISEPKYDCRYNILIGGNKLGRGVTIERLLVTYYGRQAKRPQMDTVLQHARMYGYRSADLDVSRIYLSSQLAERFKMIYESEEALREIINKYQNEGYRGIWLEKKVAPTRSNVLDPNELGVFAAGKTYFPHKPVYQKKKVADLTDKLDKLLEDYKSAPKTKAVTVDMDFIIDLISHTKCEKDSPGVWNDQRIITALETLKKEHQYAYLLVRKDRELARQETSEGLGAVYQSSELELAPTNLPTLIMLRQNGKISKKWDGQPFWIPAVRFPDGNYAIMFNLSEV
ncbi:MAG: Z1 domain-containing protein, partial [Candidatus Saccharibacteria bacterium]